MEQFYYKIDKNEMFQFLKRLCLQRTYYAGFGVRRGAATLELGKDDETVAVGGSEQPNDPHVMRRNRLSGCFRTVEGAEEYMWIMSFVSTAKKHGMYFL